MHSIVIWYMIGRYIGYWDIHNDIQYFLPDVCVCAHSVYVCVHFFTDDSRFVFACICGKVNVHKFVYIENMYLVTHTSRIAIAIPFIVVVDVLNLYVAADCIISVPGYLPLLTLASAPLTHYQFKFVRCSIYSYTMFVCLFIYLLWI